MIIVFFDLKRERFSGKVSGTIYFSLGSALNYMFMAVRSIIYTRDKKHWILCGLITATVCAYELNNARKRITKICLHTPLQFLDHIFRKNNDLLIIFSFFHLYSLSAIVIYFPKSLSYSTRNVQLTEELYQDSF